MFSFINDYLANCDCSKILQQGRHFALYAVLVSCNQTLPAYIFPKLTCNREGSGHARLTRHVTLLCTRYICACCSYFFIICMLTLHIVPLDNVYGMLYIKDFLFILMESRNRSAYACYVCTRCDHEVVELAASLKCTVLNLWLTSYLKHGFALRWCCLNCLRQA